MKSTDTTSKKSPMKRFTFLDLQRQFPTEKACLEFICSKRWANGITCRIEGRKCYACQDCGTHVHPTAGTIFHKSSTSLVTWFYVAFQMAKTRGGIAAKAIERETGVTYKTAWRMCKLIRETLAENRDPFGGSGKVVEADESYFGAKSKLGKRGRGSENKKPVLGIVERDGAIETYVLNDAKRQSIQPLVEANVEEGSEVHTDEWHAYDKLQRAGYTHKTIEHGIGEYVDGDVHTNTIEGFWGNFKMGIKGTHHFISNKYLPNYLAEWTFRYSHRNDSKPMFLSFLDRMVRPVMVSASS